MKDYAEEPKMGPTESKEPSKLHIKHADFPGIEENGTGDRVHLVIHGHVHANRAKDKFGDGEAEIHVHSIEHGDAKEESKTKNTSTMRMDDLKKHVQDKTNKMDEDMEGHSENGIKDSESQG